MGGAGVYQLLLQLLKGAAVDVDGDIELAALAGALLRNLPADPLRLPELNPLAFASV